jgi:hypothetical protein
MCGDLDEEASGTEQLYAAFLHAAHTALHDAIDHRGGSRSRLDGHEGPLPDDALHGYMDGLFADVLNACIKDGRRVDDPNQYRVLSAQAIVLARLAGFLAGQLDLREDPLRNTLGAVMAGYDAREGGGHDEHHHH